MIRLRRVRDTEDVEMPGIDESRDFIPLRIAVLTVSDTRELADDKSGTTLVERLEAAGHKLGARAIVDRRCRENPRAGEEPGSPILRSMS